MHNLLKELKNLKQQQHLSVDGLAERSGLARATISRLFADDADPRLSTVMDVVKALGASIILSTDLSRQAFAEQDVRPYRELLAEKERIIAAKDESLKRYEHHLTKMQEERAEQQREYARERKRSRIYLVVCIALVVIFAALLIADLSIEGIGWLQF